MERNETEELLDYFRKYLGQFLVFEDELPPKEGEFSDYKFSVDKINDWKKENNVSFYSHQVKAWKALDQGRDIVISTPTASGKSLIYFLKIIEAYLNDPSATFLLIYPTRALLNDQYYGLLSLAKDLGIRLPLAKFYGDEKRKGSVLFTTIDTLHMNILKNNKQWEGFLKNLRYVVVDELHQYTGVFGSVCAYVFERLETLTKELFKSKFQVICCSATIPNALEHTRKMFNRDFVLIERSGAPEPKRTFLFFNPSKLNKKDLVFLEELVKEELRLTKYAKILTFLDSRKQVEQLYRNFLELGLPDVAPYKGTYTKAKRHEIEKAFKDGKIRCLLSTNALELGINIGNLDIVNNLGIPGSGIASLLQRFGRSGRDYKRHALNILIFRLNALDQYYARHPEELFEKIKNNKSEYVIVNKDNERIKSWQQKCLLYELNRGHKIHIVPKNVDIDLLKKHGLVKETEDLFGDKSYTLTDLSYKGLRSIDEEFQIVNVGNNKILEKCEKYSIFNYLLPGMIYYSFGKPYRVKEVDFDKNMVLCEPFEEPWVPKTSPVSSEDITILETQEQKTLLNELKVYFGRIKITKSVFGYVENYAYIDYEKPYKYVFETEAFWIEFPYDRLSKKQGDIISELYELYYTRFEDVVDEVTELEPLELSKKYPGRLREMLRKRIVNSFVRRDLMPDEEDIKAMILLAEAKNFIEYGLHTIEHSIVNIAPVLFALDNRELGGRSFIDDLRPLVFIYDAIPYGIGYAKAMFNRAEDILRKSYENLLSCDCEFGCPKCVYSPRCGNQNDILNRKFGIEILKLFF